MRYGLIRMGNGYYQKGDQRAIKVNDLFDRIASHYDLVNDVQSAGLHRLWKRRLVRMAALKPGRKALDVCCGTGDVTMALAGSGANVAGLDFNARMLAVARARAAREGSMNVEFLQGDALHIPFEESVFDAVTISYGLRNLSDFERGISELHRVAKPGGRILVLDFGKPANRIWRWIYHTYLRCMVPVYGGVFCGDTAAYAYILESLQAYPAQEGVAAALRKLNCGNVRIIPFLGGAMSINYAEK
jgi:demethylmenaquinone methyltransferase/2-methoxy-6-polyprenyl-1,4-benzoquinol methylase